jgi:hypothetical protein
VPYPPDRDPPAILANEREECVVAEVRGTAHPVSGRYVGDFVSDLVLTALGPKGDVLGERAFGTLRTRREWFWSEPGGLFPRAVGIWRTRYEGGAGLFGWGERAGGDVVLLTDAGSGPSLVRLDGALRDRWTRPCELTGAVLAPPWGPRFLVYSEYADVAAFDDDGRDAGRGRMRFPVGSPDEVAARSALGVTPAGEWVVVRY